MSDGDDRAYSRREFVGGAAATAGIVATAGALAACGSSSSSSGAPPATSASTTASASTSAASGAIMPAYRTPRQGGTLRIGSNTGGSTDNLDAASPRAVVDFMRDDILYGSLLIRDVHGRNVPALAAEVTPESSSGDVWTVRLRDGVEFHNGKSLTADDLIFSLRYQLTAPFSVFASNLTPIGLDLHNGVKKLDARTVRFTLKHPYAVFDQYPLSEAYWIVPEGYNPKKPVGTGPFQYKSFTPGQESVFTAFPNYYGQKPYLDELVIVDIPDDNARVNALLSGQVDAIQSVPLGSIAQIRNSSTAELMVTPGGQFTPFVMRMDVKPFTDVRVRQAFRALIDRKMMLEASIGGFGTVANDLYCPFDPVYASGIGQREADPEQARSLLKSAGYGNGLTIELVTAPVGAGITSASQIFQQQAAAVGVTVKISQLDIGTFFGKQWGSRQFTVDQYGQPIDYFAMCAVTEGTPTALYNETHNHNAQFQALFQQGLKTVDPASRKAIAQQMQVIDHQRGGYIIPYFVSRVEAVSKKTAGWQNWPNYEGLNGFHFEYLGFA